VSRNSIVVGDWLHARLRLSDVRVICRVVNPRRTSQKIGEVSCTECTGKGNVKLIPAVKKIEIAPVEGYFDSKFPSICSQLWYYGSLKSQNVENNFENCFFWRYDPLR